MPQPKNWARRLKFSENVTNMPNYHCVHLWSKCPTFTLKAWLSPYPTRSVANLSIFTPSRTALKACGWMSVRQLLAYHSLMLLHKTLVNKTPVYLYEKLTASGPFSYSTRQTATCPPGFSFTVNHPTYNGTLRQASGSMLDISKQGWCWRSVQLYNTIPDHLRLEKTLLIFKKSLKE